MSNTDIRGFRLISFKAILGKLILYFKLTRNNFDKIILVQKNGQKK